jgi:hypothetical protein
LNEKFPSCISYGGGDGGRVFQSTNTFDEEFDGVGIIELGCTNTC